MTMTMIKENSKESLASNMTSNFAKDTPFMQKLALARSKTTMSNQSNSPNRVSNGGQGGIKKNASPKNTVDSKSPKNIQFAKHATFSPQLEIKIEQVDEYMSNQDLLSTKPLQTRD